MTDYLDKVVDSYITGVQNKIEDCVPDDDAEEMVQTIKNVTKQRIVEEVKRQYKDEVKEEVEAEIQKKVKTEKIRQLRNLMWTGFIVAFLAGLAVNQVTEIIDFFKDSASEISLVPTVVISVILTGVCVVMYIYTFVKDAVEAYKQIKKEIK